MQTVKLNYPATFIEQKNLFSTLLEKIGQDHQEYYKQRNIEDTIGVRQNLLTVSLLIFDEIPPLNVRDKIVDAFHYTFRP
jgi:hypothetical protein